MNQITDFVLQTGWVAKSILLILFVLSIISWAIILDKSRVFWKLRKESNRFLRLLKIRAGWNDLYMYSQDFKYSPFAGIIKRSYDVLKNNNGRPNEAGLNVTNPKAPYAILNKQQLSVSAVLESATVQEMMNLEKRLVILSTTVSVSPFLGLLGTVWGVMNAFIGMGAAGSSDISAVGPGIAEALITTIAGLAVAIPALVAYNIFADQMRKLNNEIEVFSAEVARMYETEQAG